MIDSYHLAIERLTSIDALVVAAVRGGAGGGRLGLLYAADIVVAADDARFALGCGALGLTADGGNTWFLPRMVGMRRAQELFLLASPRRKPSNSVWCRASRRAMPSTPRQPHSPPHSPQALPSPTGRRPPHAPSIV